MTMTMTLTGSRPNAGAAYSGFDTMPIGGEWRSGRSSRLLTDVDPWIALRPDRALTAAAADRLSWCI